MALGVERDDVKEKALKPLIERYMCAHLRETLDALGVSRMVKGHDPQGNGKVAVHCDGGLYIIDVGISAAYGGHLGAIEIDLVRDAVTVVGEAHHYAY